MFVFWSARVVSRHYSIAEAGDGVSDTRYLPPAPPRMRTLTPLAFSLELEPWRFFFFFFFFFRPESSSSSSSSPSSASSSSSASA